MRKRVAALLALALVALMAYSFLRFWAIDSGTQAEKRLHQQALEAKPAQEPGEGENPLAALWAQNPDIVGWITVPFTGIDYPVVQAKDNDYYLRRDLNGESARHGTVFLDYRCAPDGSGCSILYGHNMRDGSMFGTLKRFEDKEFLESHPGGRILFEDGWHDIAFYAFRTVPHDDPEIYGHLDTLSAGRTIVLSTCSYAYEGARMVLLGKIL